MLCSTPYGIRGLTTDRQFVGGLRVGRLCSTPYGIRGLITHCVLSGLLGYSVVLNALRHQRFDHRLIEANAAGYPSVLNALRHQRFDHSVITNGNSGRLATVLNALRHQRFDHTRRQTFGGRTPGRAQRLTASEV